MVFHAIWRLILKYRFCVISSRELSVCAIFYAFYNYDEMVLENVFVFVFVCQCVGGGRGNIDWGGGADVIIPVLSACLITCLNVRHISHQHSRTPTQVSRQKKSHACQNSWYMTLQSGKYSNWFSKGYFFDSSALQNGYERNKTQITQLQRCFEPIMWAFIVFVFWIICHIRPAS